MFLYIQVCVRLNVWECAFLSFLSVGYFCGCMYRLSPTCTHRYEHVIKSWLQPFLCLSLLLSLPPSHPSGFLWCRGFPCPRLWSRLAEWKLQTRPRPASSLVSRLPSPTALCISSPPRRWQMQPAERCLVNTGIWRVKSKPGHSTSARSPRGSRAGKLQVGNTSATRQRPTSKAVRK